MYGITIAKRKRKSKKRFRPTKWCKTPIDKYIYIFLIIVVLFMVAQAFRAPSGFWTGTYVPVGYIEPRDTGDTGDTGRLYGLYDDSIKKIHLVSTGETQEDVVTIPEPKYISLGEFKLTAYCPCIKCCGEWNHEHPQNQYEGFIQKTASGTVPKENHTIAADWSKLPKGTKVLINDIEYVVEDKGRGVKGNHIDIYFKDHQEALVFGVQYAEVFIIE